MPVAHAALDLTTRSALKAILAARPDAHVVDLSSIVPDQVAPSEPAVLASLEQIEPGGMGPIRVDGSEIAFAAFLDGIQRARVPAWVEGIPYVFGTVAAAVRLRRDRRLLTWGEVPPAVEHRFYLPLAYLGGHPAPGGFGVVDTTAAAPGKRLPTRHPAALLERALQCIQDDRERLEQRLAECWIGSGAGVLCVDGGLPATAEVRGSPNVVGIVKSHRTLYADGFVLQMILALREGERSPVFVVDSSGRGAVATWYLRVRENRGGDVLWGLVRVETAVAGDVTARADAVSRWILAERAPLALPDPRWDRMTYGIRDCEAFLRAIS